MIKLVYCIHRSPVLSRGEFHDYWLHEHAELVKRLSRTLGAAKYVQSHTIDSRLADANNIARGIDSPIYDGITEIWWKNESSMTPKGVSKDDILVAAQSLLKDEEYFIDFKRSVIFFTNEHTIFDYAKGD